MIIFISQGSTIRFCIHWPGGKSTRGRRDMLNIFCLFVLNVRIGLGKDFCMIAS